MLVPLCVYFHLRQDGWLPEQKSIPCGWQSKQLRLVFSHGTSAYTVPCRPSLLQEVRKVWEKPLEEYLQGKAPMWLLLPEMLRN